jgi:hypothetical protein
MAEHLLQTRQFELAKLKARISLTELFLKIIMGSQSTPQKDQILDETKLNQQNRVTFVTSALPAGSDTDREIPAEKSNITELEHIENYLS